MVNMKFNAMPQCRSSCDGFSFPHQQQQPSATQIMYPSGSFPTQTPPNQALAPLQSHHAYQGGSINGITKASPMQHCNTFIADARSQPLEMSNMTAHTIENLGMQDSRMLVQPSMETKTWNQKTFGDVDFTTLDADVAELGQGLISTDENAPIIDLCQNNSFDPDNIQDPYCNDLPRRMSESSFSMSSNGLMAEVPTLEDFTTSDMPYVSDCDWTHLEPAKPVISPMPSPGPPHHHDANRNCGGRSRASPIQHNNMRTSPYTLESNRTKRWSTGNYASNSPQLHSMHQFNNGCSFYGSPLNPQHSLPPATAELPSNYHNQVQNLLYSQPALQTPSATVLSSSDQQFTDASRPVHSHGLFRLLQSNADRLGGYSSHFVELSSPPDLYVSLHDEPSNPPESDMNTSDPNLIPHEQDLRFTGDLYTPRWVRGHGNKREGWCGLCKPGRWLVLKNSAFWYDKSFTHGVSAATGSAFQGPQDTRRTEGNLDVWEGLCGSCGDWIPLVSSKKKGTTWFRHAYKCHTHPKVKDGPKRRRETSGSIRARTASVAPTTCGSTTATSSLSVRQSPVETMSSIESASNSTESCKTDERKSSVSTVPQLSQTPPLSTPQMNAISSLPINGLGHQQPLEQHQKSYHDASTTFHSENSLPGLPSDADGIKMINPFESFTVVI